MPQYKSYELKIIYSEILQGSSKFNLDSRIIYFKHQTPSQAYLLEEKRAELTKLALDNFIPYEEDKIEYLTDMGLWSDEEDREIREERFCLENLYRSKDKLVRNQERKMISNEIERSKGKLYVMERHKDNILGLTLEKFVSSRLHHFFVLSSLYSDKELTTPLLEGDYGDIDDEYLQRIYGQYEIIFNKLSESTIQHICINPFFIESFSICDNNPTIFYGKPVVHLTNLQVKMFHSGCLFKTIFSEGGDRIPEDWRDKPDKLIEWYQAGDQRNQLLNKAAQGTAIMTSDPEDLKRLGVSSGYNSERDKVRKIMKEKKKSSVNFKDLM